MEADAKVAKQVGGRGFYARVWIEFEPIAEPEQSSIHVATSNNQFEQSEGWVDGAVLGATLAMRLANVRGTCSIKRIHGMPCDTNPTVVAIATIRAVWNAIGYVPDSCLDERMEKLILRSKEVPFTTLEQEIVT